MVGCGDGREAGQLARQLGVGVIGIDICADFDFTHEDSAPVTLLTMDAQTLQFDENRVEHSYPREVVDLALATRDIVLTAVRDKHPPFDGSSAPWFDVLRSVTS